MIKFKCDKRLNEHKLSLKDVEIDQFFISSNGWLCQKRSPYCYQTIANAHGYPHAREVRDCVNFEKTPIKKILPKVIKITWG